MPAWKKKYDRPRQQGMSAKWAGHMICADTPLKEIFLKEE